MQNTNRFLFILLAFTLLLSSCSVDHSGLLESIPGEKYAINCVLDRTSGSSSTRLNETSNYCFNGSPSDDAAWNICSDMATVLQLQARLTRTDATVVVAEAAQRSLPDEACSISLGTPEGVGSRSDSLSATGAVMINDDSGRVIGDSTLANMQATISSANLRVSAKFAKWRHANTSGTGKVLFDSTACSGATRCPLILRYFELELNDFTIVRPTRLAKDVKVRNAKLYTLSNYETLVDAAGRFAFKNVKAVVSGVVNGERVAFISEIPTVVTGRFDQHLGDRVAPQRLVLNINQTANKLAIRGSVSMKVNKYQTRLRNLSTNKCLQGTLNDKVVSRATIIACRGNLPKDWIFKRKGNGNAYQIKQTLSSACLNLKTSVDNREGGQVHIVGCSGHRDQLWSVASNGQIRHIASGKCLNVHRGRENRPGGLVSVYTCANTNDQRWAFQ